jgi:Animal haem peroxidase
MKQQPFTRHGILRGLDAASKSNTSEGRFGRMFRTLQKAEFSQEVLKTLGDQMVSEADAVPTPEDANPRDDEENTGIFAGYTYLGQFIDHDITFDPASSLMKQNDPDALEDFRTPRFDLDNIYGRGPDDQPYLYFSDGKKLLLSTRQLTGSGFDNNVRDLARNTPDPIDTEATKRAIIGDPRNDENVIVSQLEAMFIRFHNRMVDLFPGEPFEKIQQRVRWHYQWVIIHDFLPTILGQEMVDRVYTSPDKKPDLQFYHWYNYPYMPVEFSVAAYRFGHSMVRPEYRLNTTLPNRFDIFSSDPASSLTGFREFPSPWAIDWRLFYDFGNNPDQFSKNRIQPAYKIDTSLVNPLKNLPTIIATQVGNLAQRNLLRGLSMGLPSGQDVARAMKQTVIPDDLLKVGKANKDGQKSNKPLVSLDKSFKDRAPLWFYILSEAQQVFKNNDTPIRLGPVGGRIIAEVFFGLLDGDSHSYLNQHSHFQPEKEFLNAAGKFGIAELITQAKQA